MTNLTTTSRGSSRKKVLVISFTDLAMDPRLNRQIRFLKEHYDVIGAGAAPPRIDGVDFIQLEMSAVSKSESRLNTLRLLTRQYESYYWNYPYVADGVRKLRNVRADVVIANDVDSLPLALKVSHGKPVVFDAHEFAPLEFTDSLKFRLLYQGYKTYLCNKYIPRATEMITVCDGLAERYLATTGVNPTIMMNAPVHEDLYPRRTVGTDGRVQLIHHGGAMPTRQLELMIQMMDYLDDRFELNLMLVECDPAYMRKLRDLGQRIGRTRFIPTVPMLDIARSTNRFDIGVYLLRPNNFNNENSLPNKFFEFIQARLALAIGPSPQMAKIVKRHDLGVIADKFNPRSLASQLNRLSDDDIQRYRQNSHRVAREYSGDATCQILRAVVARALGEDQPSHSDAMASLVAN